MRSKPNNNHAQFNLAAATLRAMDYIVFNPADVDTQGGTLRQMMYQDVEWILTKAEAIVLLPHWEVSAGAKAEILLAQSVDIPVYEISDFIKNPDGPGITVTWRPQENCPDNFPE
jgi:hypothetical protein